MQHTVDTTPDLYARLHRMVESGRATEATYQQLVSVCIQLGKQQEAVEGVEHVHDPAARKRLRTEMVRRGWLTETGAPPAARKFTKSQTVTEADLNPGTRAKLEDAIQFLCEGKMPWAVLAGTIAFPVMMGLGGMVAAFSDTMVARVVAMVPVLLALGVVGALGRHILVAACHAHDDATDLPISKDLVREVPAFLRDFGALAGVFLAPIVALLVLDQQQWGALLLPVAAWLMPMSSALLLACRDWNALKPGPLWKAIRGCSSYGALAGVIGLLFLPAVLALFLTAGLPMYIVIAVTGPLSVAPFFVAMRMLGLLLHYEGAARSAGFTLPQNPRAVRGGVRPTPADGQ